jgi:thiamine-monophosphate kinase
MDSSDGLASSLHELSKQSGVNLLIEEDKIPIPTKLKKFLSINNLDFHDLVFYGGEEYNIVGTISEKNLLEISKILNQARSGNRKEKRPERRPRQSWCWRSLLLQQKKR